MADSAFIIQYRKEHVAAFEQKYSILRATCVREAVIKGNQAVFLVAGSGGIAAISRGVNGLIPYNTVSNVQNTCTLNEWHAPFERTGFNIFASQGDQKRIMQEASVDVLNRNIDAVIISQLDTATTSTGTASAASIGMIAHALTQLGNNNVPLWEEDKMFAVVTPAFLTYLMQATEFGSADYVEMKPYDGPILRMRRWMGANWYMHQGLTGKSTSAEKCYMYHQNAIGHAANTAEMDVRVGYDEKQDLSWSRATLFHGAILLQQTGVTQMLHDGSAYV